MSTIVNHLSVGELCMEPKTVVVRRKYCQGLTPVDAPKCQNCGAIKFI